MKRILFIFCMLCGFYTKAQKVDSLFFNLYTDSLKKGVYNYINVDGKRNDGSFLPLMSNEILFTSSAGRWDGNSLILDSATKADSVIVVAALKDRPEVIKSVTIFLKKVLTEPPLKTEKELLEEWRRKGSRKN